VAARASSSRWAVWLQPAFKPHLVFGTTNVSLDLFRANHETPRPESDTLNTDVGPEPERSISSSSVSWLLLASYDDSYVFIGLCRYH
jgi:hypothetical protein